MRDRTVQHCKTSSSGCYQKWIRPITCKTSKTGKSAPDQSGGIYENTGWLSMGFEDGFKFRFIFKPSKPRCRSSGMMNSSSETSNTPLLDFNLEGVVDPPFQIKTHLQHFLWSFRASCCPFSALNAPTFSWNTLQRPSSLPGSGGQLFTIQLPSSRPYLFIIWINPVN